MGDRTKFLERAPRSSRISRPVRLAAGHRGSWRLANYRNAVALPAQGNLAVRAVAGDVQNSL